MSTKFFTNQEGNSLLKKFEGVFANIPSIQHFDALVGYFRASGYFKVRPFLDNIPEIRVLVGINVDQLMKRYHDRGQYYLENPAETKEAFLGSIIQDIEQADYDEVTERGIIQFIDDLIKEKIELRAHPKQTIHAKVYIFRPANFSGRGLAGNFLEVAEIWLENKIAIRYLVLSSFNRQPNGTASDMGPQDKWLTIEDLSSYLKMSRTKLYQIAQKGELPGSKIGTQWRFDREEIDDWVKSKRPVADKKSTWGTK